MNFKTYNNLFSFLILLAFVLISLILLFQEEIKPIGKYLVIAYMILYGMVNAIRRRKVSGRWFYPIFSIQHWWQDWSVLFDKKK